LGPELMALATHDDGTIEAFSHVKYKICGIMWHPERENLINAEDLKIMKDILL